MRRQVYSDDYMGRRFDIRSSNCWHLARDVWRDMTGVDLGDLTPPRTDNAALEEAAWVATDGPQFVRLERAEAPCIVLFRRRGQMPHVGVLLRGRVLHMRPSGVQHQTLMDVTEEFERVDFYLPADKEPA